ncbi:MAG: RsmG family class I SAM-dependent methyltransferase [Pyrinomonadaceae bacterium]
MRTEFIKTLEDHGEEFGVDLPADTIGRLAELYETILEHNPILHLVGPCSPEEFAVRHILESLTLLDYLPQNARFADIGAGAGLPSIPCLIVRRDLKAILIESKEKKASFLAAAVKELNIDERVSVVNRQFEEADAVGVGYVTCRALDKFTSKLPKLLKWAGQRRLMLFGGENLAEALEKQGIRFQRRLMPRSEQRYLFLINQ